MRALDRVRRSARAAVGPVLASCALQGAAFAESTEPAVYAVPDECPEQRAWVESLQQRLPPLLRTHPWIGTLSVHVERLANEGDARYAGALSGTAAGHQRVVRGATCTDVLEALSFMGALGLQQAASAAPVSAENTVPAVAAGTDGRTPGGTDAGAAREAASEGAQRVRVGALGLALVQGGVVPGRAVAYGAAARLSWTEGTWQPLFLIGAYASGSVQSDLGGGKVRLAHWSTHVVGCPWRFPRESQIAIRPCAELDVGRTLAESLRVEDATSHAAPWISVGPELRAEIDLGDHVELGASVASVFPLWSAHFYLLPDVDAYKAPLWGPRAEAFASVSF